MFHIFRFVLLVRGDLSINPDPITKNNNSIPLNTLPFHYCDELNVSSECNNSDC